MKVGSPRPPSPPAALPEVSPDTAVQGAERAPGIAADGVEASAAPASQPVPPSFEVNGAEVVTNGASPRAAAEARAIVERLSVDPAIQRGMERKRFTVVIIPHDKKMTDVPEFASLRGRRTFDGRLWDDVRGSGGMRLADGRLAVAVAEENLAGLPSDPYQGESTAMHEIAHGIQDHVLPRRDRRAIESAYEAQRERGGPFMDTYSSSNEHEYWAEATTAWFGRHGGDRGRADAKDARWIRENDPTLYGLLERVYGAPVLPAQELQAQESGGRPVPVRA